MKTIKDSPIYDSVLKEFCYDFGNVYVFDGYVISEINEGVVVSWEQHAKRMVEDISKFIKSNGEDIVYISHRIHSYSMKPADWLKFFKSDYQMKAHAVVGYNQMSFFNTVIENLFLKHKIKRFGNIDTAIQWAKERVLVK